MPKTVAKGQLKECQHHQVDHQGALVNVSAMPNEIPYAELTRASTNTNADVTLLARQTQRRHPSAPTLGDTPLTKIGTIVGLMTTERASGGRREA